MFRLLRRHLLLHIIVCRTSMLKFSIACGDLTGLDSVGVNTSLTGLDWTRLDYFGVYAPLGFVIYRSQTSPSFPFEHPNEIKETTYNLMIVFFTNLMHIRILYSYAFIYTPLHVSSTIVFIFRRTIVLVQHLVSSLSLGDCSVHRLREDSHTRNLCTEQSPKESGDTR